LPACRCQPVKQMVKDPAAAPNQASGQEKTISVRMSEEAERAPVVPRSRPSITTALLILSVFSSSP